MAVFLLPRQQLGGAFYGLAVMQHLLLGYLPGAQIEPLKVALRARIRQVTRKTEASDAIVPLDILKGH
jgi:hypothetical protein